jgi:hypothetical protein
MSEAVWIALKVAAACYAGLCLLVFAKQSGYVYYPDRHVACTPGDAGLRHEDLRLKTEDGETIAAWYVPAAGETGRVTVLFCHGNGGDIGDRLESIRALNAMGLNVAIFDYRGYGNSTGRPSEKGTYADALAAWRHLVREKKIPAGRIVAYGESLGGAVAARLAEDRKPGALVLESTFTSARDMAARMFPCLPGRLLCRFSYDTLARLRGVKCPVLIAHSRTDEMIPFAFGKRLFEAANEPKAFVALTGGHNDCGIATDSDLRTALRQFLRQHVPDL